MRQGFSLVELSIVLVILGLLTGGILGGQALIRAAELRSVNTEYSRYTTAAYTFRDKYFALPGDISNATRFWGDNATVCADAAIADGAPGTCNGNANGVIDVGSVNGSTAEMFQFWNQLALAGLIEGTYTGRANAGSVTGSTIGINSPASRLSNAGWTAAWRVPGSPMFFASVDAKNTYQFGAFRGNTSSLFNPVLSPQEAWNIDTKSDDGKANQGFIRAIWWDECTDAVDNTALSAAYLLTEPGKVCALNIVDAF